MDWLITRRLNSSDSRTRLGAVRKIVESDNRAFADKMAALLSDRDDDVKAEVLLALARWGDPRGTNLLLTLDIDRLTGSWFAISGDYDRREKAARKLRYEIASLVSQLGDESLPLMVQALSQAKTQYEAAQIGALSPLSKTLANNPRITTLFPHICRIVNSKYSHQTNQALAFLASLLACCPQCSGASGIFSLLKEQSLRKSVLDIIDKLKLQPSSPGENIALAMANGDFSKLATLDDEEEWIAAISGIDNTVPKDIVSGLIDRASDTVLIQTVERRGYLVNTAALELGRRKCRAAEPALIAELPRSAPFGDSIAAALGDIGGDAAGIAIAKYLMKTGQDFNESIHRALISAGSPKAILMLLPKGVTRYSAEKLFVPFMKMHSSAFTADELVRVSQLGTFNYKVAGAGCATKLFDEEFDCAPLRQLAKQEMYRRSHSEEHYDNIYPRYKSLRPTLFLLLFLGG